MVNYHKIPHLVNKYQSNKKERVLEYEIIGGRYERNDLRSYTKQYKSKSVYFQPFQSSKLYSDL